MRSPTSRVTWPRSVAKPRLPLLVRSKIAHRVLRVVRDGKSFHRDVAHVEAAAGGEQAEIQVRFQE